MPILNGMETLVMVKERILAHNKRKEMPEVIRPLICYLSQYDPGTMKSFIKMAEIADCYLEKPLPIKEMSALLKLLRLF